jgi:hypothetical protein
MCVNVVTNIYKKKSRKNLRRTFNYLEAIFTEKKEIPFIYWMVRQLNIGSLHIQKLSILCSCAPKPRGFVPLNMCSRFDFFFAVGERFKRLSYSRTPEILYFNQ